MGDPKNAKVPAVVEAEFIAGATKDKDLPAPALAEVAFAGRSNVGKSSLMNAMLQRRNLVRTSSTPGCTRQINVFYMRRADGLALHFVDLPGYGYAKVSKTEAKSWQPMLEGYLKRRTSLRAVVVLVDARRGIEEEEAQLIEFMRAPRDAIGRPPELIICATKVDKLSTKERVQAHRRILADAQALAAKFPEPKTKGINPETRESRAKNAISPIEVSARTGEGCEDLWARIAHAVL